MSDGRRPLIAGALISLLAGSIVFAGGPRLVGTVRLAAQLAPLTMEGRRSTLFAPWYDRAQDLAQRIPQNAAVDVVLARPEARDIAVLSGAILQPRDCRFFHGWDAWRRRQRMEFLLDARAANAAPGPPPAPASFVILADPAASDPLVLVRHPR